MEGDFPKMNLDDVWAKLDEIQDSLNEIVSIMKENDARRDKTNK